MSRSRGAGERCHAVVADGRNTGAMTTFFMKTLRSVRDDRNLQDALFCTGCWLGFAGVVVASVVLPA